MAKTVPSSDGTVSLNADQKAILLSSLAQYLERNGFSKTLKKLQSEAQIKKDVIKGSTPDLEEIYKTYSESCMKVRLEESDNKVKEKKKKKSKVLSESLSDQVENQLEPESKDVSKSEKVKKSKDKKKRKENVASDSLVDNTKEEKDDTRTSKVDVAIQETKASKKRKRVASEENDAQLADDKAVEQSVSEKAEVDAEKGEESKGESDQVGPKDTEKTPMKTVSGQENGNVEKSTGKLAKKQRIGSAEPTSLKAFQRIKLDEVVFTDERLQDNSYWAKGGAETGYGAKAQEVLGQVRGRGFRHEKTKKKRGSYRGGQIDLQSHSVKFNYSDEE